VTVASSVRGAEAMPLIAGAVVSGSTSRNESTRPVNEGPPPLPTSGPTRLTVIGRLNGSVVVHDEPSRE
jgi:hypothetical protein